jgi:hypothetical protein
MPDELGHKHDRPEHRQGEGHNPEGDEAINRARVEQEAEKHRDPADDPAEKAEAEHRHSAARYRVLAAQYDGQEEVDPDEFSKRKQAEYEEVKADQDDKQRREKEAEQKKR